MNGPNPAKISNCILRLLYDSDVMPESSILLLLKYDKVQATPYNMAFQTGCGPFKISKKSVMLQNGWPRESDLGLGVTHSLGKFQRGWFTTIDIWKT
jgi:hypothetical protein